MDIMPKRQPLDLTILDFLSSSIDPALRDSLLVSDERKVPVVCAQCQTERNVTFFSAYKQRQRNGRYICRSCQAKVNGQSASKGLAKRVQTNLKKFGVIHPMQLPEFQEKMAETNRQRYGVSRPLDYPPFAAKRAATEYERYGGHPFSNTAIRTQIAHTNIERYGVVNPGANIHHSQAEEDIRQYLETLTQDAWTSTWDVITPHQLDGYNEHYRLAFEYCGLYWHSEQQGRTRFSHYGKYQHCQAKGIQLLTIFEDEWTLRQEQVKHTLAAKLGIFHRRIMGRQTTCRPITASHANTTLAQWHLQGGSTTTKAAWGLFDADNALVSVMTFRPHHRLASPSMIVLSRFASAPGVQILGGASKLLAAAKNYFFSKGYTAIVSWSDNRWSTGQVYQHLGFSCDAQMLPDYSYVTKQNTRRSKQSCTKTALGARPDQTEHDRARELGLSRIWDCGKIRWTLNK